MSTLRPYQADALARSLEAYQAGVNRQLMVLATGAGKTVIAAHLRQHHGFDKKILFLVHMETLAQQAADKFARVNPHLMIGTEMGGSYAAPMDTFVVGSVPTLGRKGSWRLPKYDPSEFSAIIQDEAHCGMADTFIRVYEHFGLMEPNPKGPLFLGITATPNRSDGQGLRKLFDQIVYDWGIVQGIKSGYLCDLACIRISGETNLDGIKVRAGELAQDELANAVNNPERNGLIVKAWAKHAMGRRTIVFTVTVQHALDLAAAFEDHGIAAKAVWGDDEDKESKLYDHQHGVFPVILCAQLLSIGYDDPEVACIVQAAPRKSFVRYAQEIGRGTRIADGKENCLILDVVDNSSKHNLCTISSLLGLPKDLDLKGKTYKQAAEQLERVAKEYPTANLEALTDLSGLDHISENIELFKVHYPPEIAKLSELAWRKSGESYVLAVNRDLITVTKDLRDEYVIKGRVGDKVVDATAQNIAGAFNIADGTILANGGARSLLNREAKWRLDGPSEKQVKFARTLGIVIPLGATRGMVSSAIDAKLAARV